MQNELFIALLAGLGGMVGWGLADLFAKKTIDEIGDVVSLAWGHIFGTLSLLLIAIYQIGINDYQLIISNDFPTWLLLSIFGIGQAAVYLLVYKGFGKGQVALLNPIFASFAGLTALLSIIVFKETVSGYLPLALIIIFLGILLISLDLEALKASKFKLDRVPGFKEIGIATIMAALWTLFWDKFVGGQDWLSFTFLMYSLMTLSILIYSKIKKINLFVVTPHLWKYLIFIGLGETLAYLALSWGYSLTTYTSVVALVSGAFSLPTIFLARVFLKENTSRIQTIGSLIIIAGIILVSLLK